MKTSATGRVGQYAALLAYLVFLAFHLVGRLRGGDET